ncbi:MAG: hypothetical protein HQ538_01975 [Parcubacteria group bacterium]|nr:hypothetical protein [Parcubacteria group bacterium]
MREINLRSGSKTGASSSKTTSRPVSKGSADTSKPVMLTLVFLTLAVLILGVSVAFGAIYSEKMRKANMVNLDNDKYHAVFLSNGQVYFGLLSSYNTDHPKLSDIYYLQLAQSPQAASEGQATESTEATTEGEESSEAAGQVLEQPGDTGSDQGLTLIKLGEELHGPEDSMILNKEQVLFIEQLKDDGKVVKAIEDYKENKDKEEE